MKPVVLAVAVSICVSVAAPAWADRTTFPDADESCVDHSGRCEDTDGADIRRLSQGHASRHRVVRHGLVFRKRWHKTDMRGKVGTTIEWKFNIDDDRRNERSIRVRAHNNRLTATMYQGKYLDDRVTDVRVWRTSRRALAIKLKVADLGPGINAYQWNVWVYIRNVGCTWSCIYDEAPRRGWFEHKL